MRCDETRLPLLTTREALKTSTATRAAINSGNGLHSRRLIVVVTMVVVMPVAVPIVIVAVHYDRRPVVPWRRIVSRHIGRLRDVISRRRGHIGRWWRYDDHSRQSDSDAD